MIEWKKGENKQLCAFEGFTGSCKIFYIFYGNSILESKKRWALGCNLTGVNGLVGWFKTTDEAEKKAKEVFQKWLKRANLMIPKNGKKQADY